MIEEVFSSHGIEPSELFQPPAIDRDFERLKSATALSLPTDAEAFYRIHNGQQLGVPGIIFGIELLSIDRIIENWRNWKSISEAGLHGEFSAAMSSNPPGRIRPLYVNLKWLPITHDQQENHIGIDFDPGPSGTKGQIIAFSRDEEERKFLASTFTRFIDCFIDELKTVCWTLKSDWQIDDLQRSMHYHNWPRSCR